MSNIAIETLQHAPEDMPVLCITMISVDWDAVYLSDVSDAARAAIGANFIGITHMGAMTEVHFANGTPQADIDAAHKIITEWTPPSPPPPPPPVQEQAQQEAG